MSSPERARSRLPLHPRPLPHEALSSWMSRLAETYGLGDAVFQQVALGLAPHGDAVLDRDPPSDLVAALAERTGVAAARIRGMTLAGYAPELLDAVGPAPDLLGAYVSRSGYLLPPDPRRRELPPRFSGCVPWIADDLLDGMPLGCPRCLAADQQPHFRIQWRAAWMASCPVHDVLLERVVVGLRGFYGPADGEPAPDALVALDRLTLQALTTGVITAYGDIVDAGWWVRTLRALLDEMVRPLHLLGGAKPIVGEALEEVGLSFASRGSFVLTPFERLPPDKRVRLLTAAGAVVRRATPLPTTRDPGPHPTSSHNLLRPGFTERRQDDGFSDREGRTTAGWR